MRRRVCDLARFGGKIICIADGNLPRETRTCDSGVLCPGKYQQVLCFWIKGAFETYVLEQGRPTRSGAGEELYAFNPQLLQSAAYTTAFMLPRSYPIQVLTKFTIDLLP